MNLYTAIRIIAMSHTDHDPEIGMKINVGTPHDIDVSDADYIEAWKVLRHHVDLSVEPND